MKKVLLSLFVAIAITVPSFAAKTYNAANRVSTVGSTLLTKNGIPATNVKFTVVSGAVDNSNYVTNKVVNVSSAELAYAGNDNEVAAVVANELGHIITGNASKGKVINLLQAATNTNITTNDTTTGYRRNGQNGTRHQADSRHPVRHGGHGGSLARNAGSGAVDKTTTEWPHLLSPGAHRKRRQALCDIQVSHTKQRSRERRAAAHCPRRRADIDKT